MPDLSTISKPRLALPLLALTVLASAGCASNRSRFPSLERRPAERLYGTLQPDAAPGASAEQTAPAAQAGIATRLAVLQGQADDAQRGFAAQQSAAARLAAAARGAARGSEAWSVAQIALGGLDSARSKAMVVMADLDRMLIDANEAALGGNTADLVLVKAAHGAVSRMIDDKDKTIANLREKIAG